MYNSVLVKNLLFALVALVFVYGLFLRLYGIDRSTYWMDEGFTITGVEAIRDRGEPILDSGNRYSCGAYCYITAFTVDAIGQSAYAYRLPALVSGILLVLVVFIFAYRSAGLTVGLYTLIFMSLSYWQIAWSRQARWYTFISLILWTAIWLIYEIGKLKNQKQKILLWTLSGLVILFTVISSVDQAPRLVYALPYVLGFIIREYPLILILSIFTLVTTLKKNVSRENLFIVILTGIPFLITVVWMSFFSQNLNYRYLFPTVPGLMILAAIGANKILTILDTRGKKIALVIAIITLFMFTSGTIAPKVSYSLESDPISVCAKRPYCVYTPQSNWNGAYDFLKKELKPGENVISSQPQFTKLFLNIPGYWIQYSYTGRPTVDFAVKDDREYYVGAKTITDTLEISRLMEEKTTYVVIDSFARDGRIEEEILTYIDEHFNLIWNDTKDERTAIWVYRSR